MVRELGWVLECGQRRDTVQVVRVERAESLDERVELQRERFDVLLEQA